MSGRTCLTCGDPCHRAARRCRRCAPVARSAHGFAWRHTWTPADDDELARRWAAGEGAAGIAAALGVTEGAARSRQRLLGVRRRRSDGLAGAEEAGDE